MKDGMIQSPVQTYGYQKDMIAMDRLKLRMKHEKSSFLEDSMEMVEIITAFFDLGVRSWGKKLRYS